MRGAPRGNKFWELRSKHGRNLTFSDPDLLWAAAREYFDWVNSNNLIAIEFNGKDAKRCEVPKTRPFLITGLALYLGVSRTFITDHKQRLNRPDCQVPRKDELLEVIERIENVIYVQKFEAAAAGLLNGNIISRELGLADKQQVEAKTEGTQEIIVRYERKHYNNAQ